MNTNDKEERCFAEELDKLIDTFPDMHPLEVVQELELSKLNIFCAWREVNTEEDAKRKAIESFTN